MNQPQVSIIITTRNSAKTLKQLLQSIKKQSYKNIEIIVVDNYSSDNTAAIAKLFTNKIFIKGPERSAQRNFGAKQAKGNYLFILDSDMILTPDVVKECVNTFKGSPEDKALIVPEESFGKGFWSKTKAFERQINQGEDYFEAARFFPKKVFWDVGGYDETLTGPEDWDLPQRIAKHYKLARIKSSILHNEGNPTLLGLARRKYYYGLSVHKYLKKQNISPISSKTIYFIRPGFYKKWREILFNPKISLGMCIMLMAETIGGGLGYLVGRFKDE